MAAGKRRDARRETLTNNYVFKYAYAAIALYKHLMSTCMMKPVAPGGVAKVVHGDSGPNRPATTRPRDGLSDRVVGEE